MDSRRDRNKQDKRDRIFRAASELFAEHGFARVTTQQISERADVAAGTLFRYAATKGELILMVQNAALAMAIDTGVRDAGRAADAVDAIRALLAPVLAWADEHPENTVAYQRELLFGAPDEPQRAAGAVLISRLTAEVRSILLVGSSDRAAASDAETAARSVFAVLHLALVDTRLRASERDEVLVAQLTQIVRGYQAARP